MWVLIVLAVMAVVGLFFIGIVAGAGKLERQSRCEAERRAREFEGKQS